ncbi:ATP-binding protein [Nocardia gipuzkoensis]
MYRQIVGDNIGKSSGNRSADDRTLRRQIVGLRYDRPMRQAVDYLPRRAADLVEEALADTRVVIVNGARQTGKSTLAERCLADRPAVKRYLDDPRTRSSAATDPVAFLDEPGTMLIDEVQRVPELWLAIKNTVDRDPRPGRFLLTGSARLLGLSALPDSLPGRSETIELFPLSQGEIDGMPDGFIDAAFAEGSRLRTVRSELRRRDYANLAARGGYPEAIRRTAPRRRGQFFKSYLDDIMSRDVHQVADIQRSADMRRLIATLAGQSGGLLNYRRVSADLGVPVTTIREYISLLEVIYLIRLIPAWSSNATARAIATPKLVFNDCGLAAHLLSGVTNDATTGGLLETFVLGELTRQLTWSQTMARLHHYRDRDGYEVDAILEDNAGRIIAIEVKASETVRTDDFRALRILQNRLGDRFHAGFVLYCGDQQLPFGDGLCSLPISTLWTTPST